MNKRDAFIEKVRNGAYNVPRSSQLFGYRPEYLRLGVLFKHELFEAFDLQNHRAREAAFEIARRGFVESNNYLAITLRFADLAEVLQANEVLLG